MKSCDPFPLGLTVGASRVRPESFIRLGSEEVTVEHPIVAEYSAGGVRTIVGANVEMVDGSCTGRLPRIIFGYEVCHFGLVSLRKVKLERMLDLLCAWAKNLTISGQGYWSGVKINSELNV